MKIENYFLSDKEDYIDVMNTIFKRIDNEVKKLDCGKAINEGEIKNYNDILKEKKLHEESLELSKVIDDYSKLFQRTVHWEHPGTMINITPPANIVSIVASAYAALYNPNFAQDESSGYLMATELIVSKYLSELVGWNLKKSRGIFTFGGKGTNMYAVKIGIKKAIPDSIKNGINNNDIVVFSSEKGHPCHIEICDWLGLGKNACERIRVLNNGTIDVDFLEERLRYCIEHQKKIGCIILNGGTTNELIVDPIKNIVELRDKLVEEYKLKYIPHIHVDSVIGWAWLFFKKYDFNKNNLNMKKSEIKKIKSLKNKISQIKYADSFGADFHKTGFCPYISSIFMLNDFSDVMSLGEKKDLGIDNLSFGEYSPFEYTLELTRSSIGPISAYISLELFGINGFQKLLYNLFKNCEYIRNFLNSNKSFDVINNDTEGIATLFAVLPNNNLNFCDYVNSSKEELDNFIEYNHQFYLYCLKLLEENKVHFKITFSKSYKPYDSLYKTGALKAYPMSPVVKIEELDKYLNEIVWAKQEFDKGVSKIFDNREVPIDYVYRD